MQYNQEAILASLLKLCLSREYKKTQINENEILLRDFSKKDLDFYLKIECTSHQEIIKTEVLHPKIDDAIKTALMQFTIANTNADKESTQRLFGQIVGREFADLIFTNLPYSEQFIKFDNPRAEISYSLLEKNEHQEGGVFIRKRVIDLFRNRICNQENKEYYSLILDILKENPSSPNSHTLKYIAHEFAQTTYEEIKKFIPDQSYNLDKNNISDSSIFNEIGVQITKEGLIISHATLLNKIQKKFNMAPSAENDPLDKSGDGGNGNINRGGGGENSEEENEGVAEILNHPILFSMPRNDFDSYIDALFNNNLN